MDNKGLDIKLRVDRCHFAYVNKELLLKAMRSRGNVININTYIRDIVYNNYKIKLETKKDIELLKEHITKDYYGDIREFLQEKMREDIRNNKGEE